MWALLAVFALLVREGASVYTCPSSDVTVKFQGQPYYFPPQGADDHYASNQNCSWIIQVPDGYYAKWGFTANLVNADGQSDDVETAVVYGDIESWSFWFGNGWDTYTDTLSDQLKIILKSGNDSIGTFHFNVTWMKEVPPAVPVVRNVDEYGYSVLNLWELNDQNVVTFSIANNAQLSLATDCVDETDLSDILVYDGTTVSGDHKNLEDAIFEELESSTNHAYTLYNPIQQAPLDNCIVIANDARDTAQFDNYDVFYDPYTHNRRDSIGAQPGGKPSAITYYAPDGQNITLYGITWHQTKNEELYGFNGVPNPTSINTPDVVFKESDGRSPYPYTFNSSTVTFVIYGSSATLEMSPSSANAPNTVNVARVANRYSKTIDYANSRRVMKTISRKHL